MLSHDDVLELTGAYVVNAVDENERLEIENHLAQCSVCRREVAELSEAAGALALVEESTDSQLWGTIQAKLTPRNVANQPSAPSASGLNVPKSRVSQSSASEPNVSALNVSESNGTDAKTATHLRAKSKVNLSIAKKFWAPSLAAAAVLLVVSIGAAAYNQQNKIEKLEVQLASADMKSQALEAERKADSRKVNLVSSNPNSNASAVLVILADRTAYFMPESLSPLSEDQVYQVWAVVGGAKISVAILGSTPSVWMFKVPDGASAVAVTAETAGGVVVTDHPAVISGLIA